MTWTTQALAAGGILTVRQALPGKTIFRATMEWPNEPSAQPVHGRISMRVEGALKNLESALMEDCANEMLRSGAA